MWRTLKIKVLPINSSINSCFLYWKIGTLDIETYCAVASVMNKKNKKSTKQESAAHQTRRMLNI